MAFARAVTAEAGRVDDSYFESYSYLDIHREMLSDKVILLLPPCIAGSQTVHMRS